jgi:hypothetical protein
VKLLHRRYEVLIGELEKAASLGVQLTDALAHDLTPELLDKIQDSLRIGLVDIESRLREWRDREGRRKQKILSLRARTGTSSPVIGEHLKVCEAYETKLLEFRSLLRQLGDAVAWILLRCDPRVIAPLFAPRHHFLSLDAGIVGPTQLIGQAHRSGRFLVLDNDLTRCVGAGDITVLPADRSNHTLPLSLEVKTKVHGDKLEEGVQMSVDVLGVVSNVSEHAALHKEFGEVLAMNDGTSPHRVGRPVTTQESKMKDQAELLLRMMSREREVLAPTRMNWSSLQNVIDKTLQGGSAYDIPENGIAIVGVRNKLGDNVPKTLEATITRLQADGFPKGEPYLSLDEFTENDRLSPFYPPIALWPIPSYQREALLSRRILLAGVFSSSLWNDVLAEEGLTLLIHPNGWVVQGGTELVRLDTIEVAKLRVGVAFGGISARAVARSLRITADS